MTGLVFDIQRFSIHNGPGIRTTVFMKGCSLNCAWCHNPESISFKPEIRTYFERCIACGKCCEVCSEGAQGISEDGKTYDRTLCKVCGKCVSECYAKAIELTGKPMSVVEVMEEIMPDVPFYKSSGGGVTVSGGEPLMQPDFTSELLYECKKVDIHTAVDTAGNVPFKSFLKVEPFTDLFLYDVKSMDTKIHREFTGAGNELILDNLRKLDGLGKPIRIRIPVIEGVNADDENMKATADFLKNFENLEGVELLPYHKIGAGKLQSLGEEARAKIFEVPGKEKMMHIFDIFDTSRIKVIKG